MTSMFDLPPELIQQIVDDNYSSDYLSKKQKLELSQLSLISRKFYLPSRRIMLSKLTIDSSCTAVRFIQLFNSNCNLGPMVKEFGMNQIDEGTCDWTPNLAQFLILLPNLRHLSVIRRSPAVSDLDISTIIVPTFASLTSLYVTISSPYNELNLLFQLINHSPNLKSLVADRSDIEFAEPPTTELAIHPFLADVSITFQYDSNIKYDLISQFTNNCPNLKELSVGFRILDLNQLTSPITTSTFPFTDFRAWSNIREDSTLNSEQYQLFANNFLGRFPITCFSGLKQFSVEFGTSITSIREAVKASAATLEELTLNGFPHSYQDIYSLFPYLQNLKTLKIDTTIVNLPHSFFQHLPASITEIDLAVSIQLQHFQHLQLHPRPSFQVEKWLGCSIDVQCFSILPQCLRNVFINDLGGGDFPAIHQALSLRVGTNAPDNIGCSTPEEFPKEYLYEWQDKFDELDVSLDLY